MSMDATMNKQGKRKVEIKVIAQVGMLAAIATVLMLFEIPLPFAPGFYEIDFSEVPVLVGCFAMGPVAGVMIELVKIILNFVVNGTITAGVGEAANFLIGCALCVPAGIVYRKYHTRKGTLAGMAAGTVFMTVIGCLLNAYVLLPAYAKAFELPLDGLVGMGTAVNSHITNLTSFVMFAVAPFNLLKGVMTSAVVYLIYKKISPVFKQNH